MPTRALHFCNWPGCANLTGERYCDDHAPKKKQDDREKGKAYDRARGSRIERGYDEDWKRARLMKLSRDPLCEMCLEKNLVVPAEIAHHKIAIREDPSKRLDLDNLVSVCASCHEEIESPNRFGRSGGLAYPQNIKKPCIPVTVVCGAPGSGKSYYVSQNRGDNDLVLDLDEIISELSGRPLYQVRFSEWVDRAMMERNQRINSLAYDSTYDRAWIISTSPKKSQRDFWRDKLGADVIVLETPANECARRCDSDDRRPQAEISREARRILINKWWSSYEQSVQDKTIRK